MGKYSKLLQVIAVLTILIIIVLIIILNNANQGLGETGGYCFNNRLHYRLPKSGIEVKIHATGFVEEGADLGTGKTNGVLSRIDKVDSLEFFISIDLDSVRIRHHTFLLHERDRFWQMVGYLHLNNLNMEELNELESILFAASSGPKGSYLSGQTNFVEVVETRLETKYNNCKE